MIAALSAGAQALSGASQQLLSADAVGPPNASTPSLSGAQALPSGSVLLSPAGPTRLRQAPDADGRAPVPSTTSAAQEQPRWWGGSLRCGDHFDIQSSQTFKWSRGIRSGIKKIRNHGQCAQESALQTAKQSGGLAPEVSPEAHAAAESRDHWIAFGVTASIILVAALALLAAYNAWADAIERLTGITLTHVCCIAFMLFSISIDLSMKSAAKGAGHGRYNFDPAVAVLIVELSKLVISAGLVGATELPRKLKGQRVAYPTVKDCCWLAVPGFVYTATNIIAYEAIQNIPLATFSVLRETRLFWNAFLWVLLFQTSLSRTQWLGVSGIFVGCTVSQLPVMMASEFTPEVMWVLVLAFLTAAGGVMTEYAMKQRAAVDINLQGCVIYVTSCFFTLMFLLIARSHLFISAADFFHGFEPECMQIVALQVLQGLTVSRILKHVESVTKSIVSSLCSPLLTFIGSVVMKYSLRPHEIMASLVVFLSCMVYLKDGPLGFGQPKDLDSGVQKLLERVTVGRRRLTV